MAHSEKDKKYIMEVFGITDESQLKKKIPNYSNMQIAKEKGLTEDEYMAIWMGGEDEYKKWKKDAFIMAEKK